jgi:pyrimidine-nucleoside phosphorylase
MLYLAGATESLEAGVDVLAVSMASGAALAKLKEMIQAQGGDPAAVEDTSKLPLSRETLDVFSDAEGYVSSIDARGLGAFVCEMGGGRLSKDDSIDHGVGATLLKKEGDPVRVGEPLVKLYAPGRPRVSGISERAREMFVISSEIPKMRPLVQWIVTSEGPQSWEKNKLPVF